jgi:hypothetical protein
LDPNRFAGYKLNSFILSYVEYYTIADFLFRRVDIRLAEGKISTSNNITFKDLPGTP